MQLLGCRFSELPELSPETLQVLERLGFERATPVQEATLPLFCGNKDVAVDACTGSGKTLAFVLPVVEKLRRLEEPLKKHQVGAIIISPTRELSRQIATVAEPFIGSVQGATCQLLVGGTDPAEDVARFKEHGAHVLIGTPGRIDDVMKRCSLMEFKRVEVLVLDEADRLLDMGFKAQLDNIMGRLPRQRRTGLFSATQTEAVEALARAGLRNPVRVNVAVTRKQGTAPAFGGGASTPSDTQKTPTGLDIQYMTCEADEKLQNLVLFLRQHSGEKVIVYFLTCSCVDFFSLALRRLGSKLLPGLQVSAMHGRMKQAARESTLETYTKLPAGVLLCTDLAARGLDIPDVNWILQFDPPQDPASFVHRVGRTARMGRAGHALVFLLPHEATYVDFLRLRKVPLVEVAPPAVDGTAARALGLVKREAETDREVMEAGTRAFVSYVRGYKEHHCKYIFRIQDLSLGRLATSFALLRLPRMPEIKKGQMQDFTPSEVDPDSVKFKDKAREKQRQQNLKREAAKPASGPDAKRPNPKGAAGASKQHAQAQQQHHQAGERLPAAKRRKLQQQDELQELTAEYTLLKKLKRGKISQREFDVATGLESDDEAEAGTAASAAAAGQPLRAGKEGVGKLGAGRGTEDSDSDVGSRGSDSDGEEGAGPGRAAAGAARGKGGAKAGAVKGKGGRPSSKKGAVSATGSKLQRYMDQKKKRQKRRGRGGGAAGTA